MSDKKLFEAYYRKHEDAGKVKPAFYHHDVPTLAEAIDWLRKGRDNETCIPVCIQDSDGVTIIDSSQIRRALD